MEITIQKYDARYWSEICRIHDEPAKRLYESFGFAVREILSGQMPGNEQFSVKVYSMYRNMT